MLEAAERYRDDFVEGRWIIEARHRRKEWEIIVEPDRAARLLVVVTGYAVTRHKKR